MSEKRYMILDYNLLTVSALKVSSHKSFKECRISNDGTKYVVSFFLSEGFAIPDVFMGQSIYTESELLTQLSGANWDPPDRPNSGLL